MQKVIDLVDLELAKRLKEEGYSIPTQYYYQDKDLPYSSKGLKKMKNDEKLNHNSFDDFIYSAPSFKEGVEWLHGKHINYESSVVIKFGCKNES